MTRFVKWLAVASVAIVVLAVAVLAAVPYLVDTPRIQSLIAGNASQALGRPVKFSSVSVSTLPLPAVVLKDLEVAEDPAFGTTPFLKLNQAEIRLRLWPLLLFRVELGDLVLKEPVISLVETADGHWNIASLGRGSEAEARAPGRTRPSGGAGAGAVLPSRVKVDKGLVTYESRAGGTTSRYRVENLNLTLTGATVPLAFQGDARVKPGDLAVKITDGTVGVNGARSLVEAPLRARLTLDGKDIRELVATAMGPEPTLAGGLKGTLALGGTVGKPRASGDVELTNLAVTQTNPQCPEPKRRTLALGLVKLNTTWEESRLIGRPVTTEIGKGTITTNLSVALDRGVRVELGDLGIKTLPVEKILVDFLCQGYAVTGPLDLSGNTSARLDDLWNTLNGKGQFKLGPGKVVGAQALALLSTVLRLGGAVSALAGGELPTVLSSSAFDYETVAATYTVTNGVVSTRDLLLTSRALKASAAGTYALASGQMNVDLVVTTAGRNLKAKVTGTAASPSVSVAPASVLSESERKKLQEKVEGGLQDLLKKFR